MNPVDYVLTDSLRGQTVTVVLGSGVRTIAEGNPGFDELIEHLAADTATEETLLELINLTQAKALSKDLSEHTDIVGYDEDTDHLIIDGIPIEDEVLDQLTKAVANGPSSAWRNLAHFLNKLSKNPSLNTRQKLLEWVTHNDLIITHDGRIIAHKGLTSRHTSRYSGAASVDGVEITGVIPNEVHTTVTMPRKSVDDNVNNFGGPGLHVASYKAAYEFGEDVVASVIVDPEAVVTVIVNDPHKIRVSEYYVLSVDDNPPYPG